MDKLLPLIQLDKVYGGGRDTIKLVHDKFFMVRPRPDHEGEGGERHSFMFTQLLFDTDSGFLQSLEWKGQMIASSTIEVH